MSTERKRAPTRAKLFMASDLFFCRVLRILLSELDKGQDKPSLGTKESCPRTSGHPTLRIRRSAEERFVLMMKIMEFHGLETADKAKWTIAQQ